MADKMSIDKNDHHSKDDSEDSMGSSPEGEAVQQPSSSNPQEGQQPKRKGGRKPIYATSEERKQRNRQAQAAFRERRTEYIKQLEETIRTHENNLHNLQTAHRTAADEVLMLRYKNSLLERILLEKGIDVQAELRAKTGSPNLGPTHMPQNMVQPPPIQRVLMNRHHQSRRSGSSSIAPKIEPGASPLPPPVTSHSSATSPKSKRTPSSHTNSPTSAGPAFGSQTAASPATSDHMSMRTSVPPAIKQQMSPVAPPPMTPTSRPAMMHTGPAARVNAAPFYASPAFQNHIEELEQEYEAPEMIDDSELDTPSGPGPYPAPFVPEVSQPMTTSAPTSAPGHQLPTSSEPMHAGQPFPSMTQLLDSNLDWDPFGLSASMAFPTQFTFDPSNSMR